MLHPIEVADYARARHQDLLREAEAYRRGQAVAPPRRGAAGGARRAARWRLAAVAAALAGGALVLQLTPSLLQAWSG